MIIGFAESDANIIKIKNREGKRMKKIIKGRIYDTDKAKQLNFKYAGEYGDAGGYEERLYLTKSGQYFIFGTGGSDSLYPKPTIKPIKKEQADEWLAELSGADEVVEEKGGKAKKTAKKAKDTDTKAKKLRKPPSKKSEKNIEAVKVVELTATAEPVTDAEPVENAE